MTESSRLGAGDGTGVARSRGCVQEAGLVTANMTPGGGRSDGADARPPPLLPAWAESHRRMHR